MRGVLTRDVMVEECPWLAVPMRLGSHVYRYEGATYGVIAPWGVACSVDGGTPFFELPTDAIEWLELPNA